MSRSRAAEQFAAPRTPRPVPHCRRNLDVNQPWPPLGWSKRGLAAHQAELAYKLSLLMLITPRPRSRPHSIERSA